MSYVGDQDIALRSFNKDAEDEATWLAGTLLLPRDALLYVRNLAMEDIEVCSTYGVSPALLRYRLDKTGVTFQLGGRGRRQN